MSKSTGPLLEQLGVGTSSQSTPNTSTNMAHNKDNSSGSTMTSTADTLGANKTTNAIPQENPSVLSSAGVIGKNCMFFSFPLFLPRSYTILPSCLPSYVPRPTQASSNPQPTKANAKTTKTSQPGRRNRPSRVFNRRPVCRRRGSRKPVRCTAEWDCGACGARGGWAAESGGELKVSGM